MKVVLKKSVCGGWRIAFTRAGLLVVLAAAITGCLDRATITRDLTATRAASFQRWQRQRSRQDESTPRIAGKLSLEDAVKLALLHNKPLLAVLQDKGVARGRVIEAYGEALPTVSAIGGYTRFDKKGLLSSLNSYSLDLQVRQPIFHGGAITATIRSAQLSQYLTDETVRAQVQATIYDVATNYYASLLAQQLFEVNRDAVLSAEAHLKDVRVKASEGVASRFDILRAEVDVSNFRAEMIRQQNALHLSKTRLLKAIGVTEVEGAALELADELTYEPIRPVLEEAVRIAAQNRPDLYQAELGVRVQQEALRIARSRYWPTVDAVFTEGWSRPDPHTGKDSWGDQWFATLEVSYPIFDLRREGKVIREKATLERRHVELLDVEERALLEVQLALLSVRDAEEFVESQRLNQQRAQEGLRLAQVGYREGVTTEVEVVDARSALTTARGLYFQAIHDHTRARLELQRAMGILGPAAGQESYPVQTLPTPARIDVFSLPVLPTTEPATQPTQPEPGGMQE